MGSTGGLSSEERRLQLVLCCNSREDTKDLGMGGERVKKVHRYPI